MHKSILSCLLIGLVVIVLCSFRTKRLPEGVGLESFRYETYGMMAGAEMSLSIFREEDGFAIVRTGNWGEPSRRARGSAEMGKKIADVLRENNALSWDGFSGRDSMILDGESFKLTIAFDDGTTISACGTNRRPKGMGKTLREIENFFDQLLRETEQ